MTQTYRPLATVTLGSSASSVTFSSIPATYRDLILIAAANGSSNELNIRFNGDSGANYSRVVAYGPGPTSFAQTGNTSIQTGIGTSNFQASITQIMDYSATDKHKTVLNRGSTSVVAMGASRWANTAAITTLLCSAGSGTFASGSTFSLYGVIA
jgi:hypothetical protein